MMFNALHKSAPSWPCLGFAHPTFWAALSKKILQTQAVAKRVPFLNLKTFLCSAFFGYVLRDLGVLLKILSWDFSLLFKYTYIEFNHKN